MTPGELILQTEARRVRVEVRSYGADVENCYEPGTELRMTKGGTVEILKSVDLEFLVDFVAMFGGGGGEKGNERDKLFWKAGEKKLISAGEILDLPHGAEFRFKDKTCVEYK